MLSAAHRFPALIADIGGTNARFALLTRAGGQPQQLKTLACNDYPDIVSAIEAYLSTVEAQRPWEAVVAIANPVTGDHIKMTNHVWSFSIEESRKALNLINLHVINDFTALALSLPLLRPNEQVQVGSGRARPRSVIGLIGPGTGLGVSGLVPVAPRGWQALAGEGGHASFSPVNDEEDRILNFVRQKHQNISTERLVSGPGLVRLYGAIAELAGDKPQEFTPADVSKHALAKTDAHCERALDLFCAMLGSAAGNLALTLGAEGGVYIGGGIVPGILSYFKKSRFRQQFEAKGRLSDYLANIPTFVITASNPALLGAAALLQQE
ncbi:glucokinase [Microvirga sp. W0021]|uniref:Glucokinase n=1 Tax=Hohaiivirga grylli TaxID=3133970 RepID=A0ABV0BJQ2_9HYPH